MRSAVVVLATLDSLPSTRDRRDGRGFCRSDERSHVADGSSQTSLRHAGKPDSQRSWTELQRQRASVAAATQLAYCIVECEVSVAWQEMIPIQAIERAAA